MTFKEICNKVLHHLLQIDEKLLAEIVDETFNFPLKIHSINSSEHFLETYWGPTHTFKDFGARFMANYLQKILHKKYCRLMHKPHFTVIVSTSGDTGSAIASAFLNKPNFNVIILYPNITQIKMNLKTLKKSAQKPAPQRSLLRKQQKLASKQIY